MTQPNHSRKTKFRILRSKNRVPKVIGADVELGNFIEGLHSNCGSGQQASRLLLREIPGIAQSSWSAAISTYMSCDLADAGTSHRKDDYLSQDWGRKFLPGNGGCVYIDLNHLELCTPEVTSAFDYVAAWHAMLLVARRALEQANSRAPAGRRIQVLVNNSDGLGNSYGSHLNFLVSRRTWDNIFHRKLHYQALLASYQATSVVFAGQGKVGAENGTPAVDYQLSQRADFFETMTGQQTIFRRPLVNSRDEPLCGLPSRGNISPATDLPLARLHCIFYDSNLCHVACLLKCGIMQIVLAMLEAGCVPSRLILEDPLEAVRRVSRDPSLRAQVRTTGRKRLTAVEWQLLFLEEARRFVEAGGCDGMVPRADEILDLATDTLEKLRVGNLPALAGRLDWVLKLSILQRAMTQHPALTWDSPEMKHLDHAYSSLDPKEGLYWLYEKVGAVEQIAAPGQIERLIREPPEDTRAFTRAMLLRLAGARGTSRMDWDYISVKLPGRWGWPHLRTVEMPDPTGHTRDLVGQAFEHQQTITDLLDALETPNHTLSKQLEFEGETTDVVPQTAGR